MLSAKVPFSYYNFYDYWESLTEFAPDFGMGLEALAQKAASSSFVEASHDGMVSLLRIWKEFPPGRSPLWIIVGMRCAKES